jgi:hypothetical protein
MESRKIRKIDLVLLFAPASLLDYVIPAIGRAYKIQMYQKR